MQLAASQRPHPPPVPPRPSRQVVAEALKRSPRPPCPTRQAPPPPNTKPWRSNNQEILNKPGRTVVYESNNQETSLDVDIEPEVSLDKDIETKPEEQELNVIENNSKVEKENQNFEKESKSEDEEINYSDVESVESPIPQSRRPSVESLLENEIYELVEECRLKNLEKRDGQDPKEIRLGDIQLDPSRPRLRSQKMNLLTRDRVRSRNKDEIDGHHSGKSQRPLVRCPKPLERTNWPRPPIPARNNIQIGEKPNLEKDTRPRLPLKPRQRLSSQLTNDGSEINKSILNDGATVVIVDEPERKVVVFNDDGDNIHHQDWLEAGVRYSSTQITLSGDDEATDRVNGFAHLEDEVEFGDLDFSSILERIAMSSLQGLPPLPRSLSGFNLNSGRGETGEPPPPPTRSSSKAQRSAKTPTNVTQSSSRPSPPARQLTTLDTQLAILRREMFGLRQLDLSLLSQLWSLNESIQEFRQLLQEQEDRAPSPSPSSEDGDDNNYGPHPRRPAPTLHHHRPPRPPRPPKPPPSDESPSSEEYGAV